MSHQLDLVLLVKQRALGLRFVDIDPQWRERAYAFLATVVTACPDARIDRHGAAVGLGVLDAAGQVLLIRPLL